MSSKFFGYSEAGIQDIKRAAEFSAPVKNGNAVNTGHSIDGWSYSAARENGVTGYADERVRDKYGCKEKSKKRSKFR